MFRHAAALGQLSSRQDLAREIQTVDAGQNDKLSALRMKTR